MKRQWSDGYGARWYLHYDGIPPLDTDDEYHWNGTQWCVVHDYDGQYLEHYEQGCVFFDPPVPALEVDYLCGDLPPHYPLPATLCNAYVACFWYFAVHAYEAVS